MKKRIFVDFNLFLIEPVGEADDYITLDPIQDSILLLKALNIYYEVRIFTSLEREFVYKWFILHRLDAYIADVVSHKDSRCIYLSREVLKWQDDYINHFWQSPGVH
jgi:hypothetical protein